MNTGETIALIKALGKGGGGGSLPAVTSSDNGKVLTVENGAWVADANVYIINVSNNVADIGATEIQGLVNAGFVPVLKSGGNCFVYTHSSGNAYFIRTYYSNSKLFYQYASVASNKNVATGFATGLYSKPSDGIPEADLAQAVKDKLNKFVVTLTPTSPDFSGTMDKTANEITAAYEAGQEIVFNVVGFPGFDHVYIPAAWCTYATDMSRCAACATLVDVTTGLQIVIVTSDGGSSTYSTTIYSLTPAS